MIFLSWMLEEEFLTRCGFPEAFTVYQLLGYIVGCGLWVLLVMNYGAKRSLEYSNDFKENLEGRKKKGVVWVFWLFEKPRSKVLGSGFWVLGMGPFFATCIAEVRISSFFL